MSFNKTAIILVNLGSPSALNKKSIKKYLIPFLTDKRVIDLNPLFWQPLLRGIIIPRRIPKLIHAYQLIWTKSGSPLVSYGKSLQQELQSLFPQCLVKLAMTYGEPNLYNALENVQDCKKVIILPLFPQYSSTTTGAVWDSVWRFYSKKRYIPELILNRDYAENEYYINALVESIKKQITDFSSSALLCSYHGIPLRYAKEGDDYSKQCELTTEKLKEKLPNLPIFMSYQSRFGKEPWLEPYTENLLAKLPQKGFKSLYVVCPGFAADCLETLEEINIRGRETFKKNQGTNFHYIPALNDNKSHLDLLANLIKSRL